MLKANTILPTVSQMGYEGDKKEKPAWAAILAPVLDIKKPRITPIIPPIAPNKPDSSALFPLSFLAKRQ